jgi:AcrR family transcriptional regulator
VDVTDPRAVRTRQRVLDATVKLLAEHGVQAANMEAIAAAAGTSRSTLYRHWPDRLPLLIDAVEHLGSRFRQAPSEGPSVEEPLDVALQRIVGGIGDGLRSPDWGPIAGSLAAAAEHDPELAEVHSRYVAGRRQHVVALLQHAQTRGELPDSLDADWAVDLLVGPLYYHRLILHEALTAEHVKAHVRQTLTLLRSAAALAADR